MENQDKNIDKHFRKLTEEQKPKSFPNMDKVWDNIEQKLDQKDKKRVVPFWKYAGIAAAVLVFVSLGIQFINNHPETEEFPLENNQRVVIDEKKAKEILEDELKSDEDIYAFEEVPQEDAVQEKTKVNELSSATERQLEKEVVTSQEEFDETFVSVVKEPKIRKADSITTKPEEIASKENLKQIKGIIRTEYGDPIPGASVLLVGSNQGSETDLEGTYSLNAKKGDRVKVAFEGFKPVTLTISSSDILNFTMIEEDPLNLADVVVDTYRTTSKEKVVTGTSTVTSQTIEGRPNASFVQTLQGQVPGLNIATGNEKRGFLSRLRSSNSNRGDKSTKKINEVSFKEVSSSFSPIFADSESYENFTENPFESAKSNPVSTFSIDVDNAAYTNIRRFINNGQTVPKDAVRVEEMINFFKYDYPQPINQHPFSINTEYSDASWNPNHKLLKIGLKGKEIPTDKLPKSNFVFLVDVSGSMSAANKLPLLQASMKVLLDELRPDDRVSVVYYANSVGVLLEPTLAKEKEKIIEVIDNLRAGGGTSGGAGLELAYEMAEKHFVKNGNNRIILATDGDFNIGKSSDKEMQELIEEKRKSGVFLTCLGFGMGNYKDSKMITLAKKGNGNYAYIDNIQEANRFLGKEFKGSMFAIAKDVKIQIEFNPAHVQAYRLIGYEMRKLRNEDFTNDAIDAGELGSGHTVTALYEVIPNGIESEFYSYESDLKYTKNKASDNFQNELATVKFRYKNPKEDKSIEMVHTVANRASSLKQASKDFKFASAVAWFGLKLRDSKLITNRESTDIVKLAREGIQNDADGYKAEFIRLVESVK